MKIKIFIAVKKKNPKTKQKTATQRLRDEYNYTDELCESNKWSKGGPHWP